jgi:hypothetical protein
MEDFLTGVPKPEVSEGGHRAELKARLLQEAARPNAASPSPARWRRRLVWAALLAVVVTGIAGAATALRSFVVRGESKNVTVEGRDGPVTWGISSSGSYPATSQEEANALHDAIEKAIADGKYELVKTVPDDPQPVYIYKITLPDGSTTQIGCEHLPRRDPAEALREVQNQIDQGSGELVGINEVKGFPEQTCYSYRYILSDGGVEVVGRGAPYLGGEEAVRDEVKRLFAEGKGELKWGPPNFADMYCYRFTLTNGKRMLYFTYSPQPEK